MTRYSFIFHKNVYLRQIVESDDYHSAEEKALEMDESIGQTFETPFLLAHSKRVGDQDASEQMLGIPQA